MIKRIKKIDNRGIFKSYVGDATLEPFNRYNIFYGLNGSGKSTLSSLFRDIEMRAISEKFPLNTWELEIEQGQLTHENIQNHCSRISGCFYCSFINSAGECRRKEGLGEKGQDEDGKCTSESGTRLAEG